mmetsp:Transcript_21196/g.59748  ORF Transcript_21196/g.59748 Transcript_21196/m.59748 type:complete len:313 (+) Transcript_21196:129-1067(+)
MSSAASPPPESAPGVGLMMAAPPAPSSGVMPGAGASAGESSHLPSAAPAGGALMPKPSARSSSLPSLGSLDSEGAPGAESLAAAVAGAGVAAPPTEPSVASASGERAECGTPSGDARSTTPAAPPRGLLVSSSRSSSRPSAAAESVSPASSGPGESIGNTSAAAARAISEVARSEASSSACAANCAARRSTSASSPMADAHLPVRCRYARVSSTNLVCSNSLTLPSAASAPAAVMMPALMPAARRLLVLARSSMTTLSLRMKSSWHWRSAWKNSAKETVLLLSTSIICSSMRMCARGSRCFSSTSIMVTNSS